MNHVAKKSLHGVQRAFQHQGINRGKLLGAFLEHRVDHLGPGRMPFPTERGYLRADSPPVGWIISPFNQTVRLQAVHQLRDVGPHAGKLFGQLAEADRSVLANQDRQSASNFAMDSPTPANASSRRASTR